MAIVRTQLALVARAGSLDAARAAARTADESVVHAERILAQLLLMARVDRASSQRLLAPGPVDLTAIAESCVAERVARAANAGIDLGFQAVSPCPVRADALLAGEMIGNLIDNAIAYAGPGAETTVRVTDGPTVTLEVEDNGLGIASGKLAGLGGRFTRASDERPGAGLGLAIVQEIAALFGGELELGTGTGGRGFRARISLPSASGQELDAKTSISSAPT